MPDITERIRRDVEDDVTLKPHAFTVDLSRQGFIKRQNVLQVGGTVANERELNQIRSIVDHHAGDAYKIDFALSVREHADA